MSTAVDSAAERISLYTAQADPFTRHDDMVAAARVFEQLSPADANALVDRLEASDTLDDWVDDITARGHSGSEGLHSDELARFVTLVRERLQPAQLDLFHAQWRRSTEPPLTHAAAEYEQAPGGVPAAKPGERTDDISQRRELLSTRELATTAAAAAGVAVHAVKGAALALPAQAHELAMLPNDVPWLQWAVRDAVDRRWQPYEYMLQHGELPPPDFEPVERIARPTAIHSELVGTLVRGMPSLWGGPASGAEILLARMPGMDLGYGLLRDCSQGSGADCAEALGAAYAAMVGGAVLGKRPAEAIDLAELIGRQSHHVARFVAPGGAERVIVGHGVYRYTDGVFVVPSGTTVTVLRPGVALGDIQGRLAEMGQWNGLHADAQATPGTGMLPWDGVHPDFEGAVTFLPGARIPNYTVGAVTSDMSVQANSLSIAPGAHATLDQLIPPGAKDVKLAICTTFVDESGEPIPVFGQGRLPEQFDLPGATWLDPHTGEWMRDARQERAWREIE